MTLEEQIVQIVHKHSGGIKLVELVCELSAENKAPPQLEEIEAAIESSNKIAVLRYSYHMSEDLSREKMFVYTP
jgi:hypothetical protein